MQMPGYRIEKELGRGGMAVVYLATQESLGRHVALKVMNSALSDDPDFTRRFLKEGSTVAKLTHPGIIRVFDTNVHGGYYYLSMEYLPGGTLKRLIKEGMSLGDILGTLKTIAGALGYAHSLGIVHRDVKAQNILLYPDGTPVLSDFGIAKAGGGGTVMTATGAIIGSPRYMSPEQIRGETVDGRTDIYSLGILFHEMLTGKPPFDADDNFALAYKHIHSDIPGLPERLAPFQPLLDRMLAKDKEQRFADCDTLLDALARIEALHLKPVARTRQPSEETQSHRRNPFGKFAAAGVSLTLVAAAVGLFLLQSEEPAGSRQAETEESRALAVEQTQDSDDVQAAGGERSDVLDARAAPSEPAVPAAGGISEAMTMPEPAAADRTSEAAGEAADTASDGESPDPQVARLVEQAWAAYRRDALTTPDEDNAVKWAREAYALAPDDPAVKQVFESVVDTYLRWTESNLDLGQTQRASLYLQRLSELTRHASTDQLERLDDQQARLASLQQRTRQGGAGGTGAGAGDGGRRPLMRWLQQDPEVEPESWGSK